MQAIEFESVVQDQTIRLPAPGVLSPGQPVRVVVMFEETSAANTQQPGEGAISRLAANPDAISELCENPLLLPGFLPLSRDETHER
jgi:hypothetical protein